MLKPPIPWYGGKQKLVKDLLRYVPEHVCYVEPYGGAGALLFAKKLSKVEIYNDLHKDVVNLYRAFRYYPRKTFAKIRFTPYSYEEIHRSWLDSHKSKYNTSDTVTEQARCFFVIARQSFSSRHETTPGWSSSKKTNHALAWMNAIDSLPEIHKRLQNVQIECRPAIEVIKKYDGIDTFQYLDPPYLNETRKELGTYSHEMTDNDHFELLTAIKNLKSMFLVSGYQNEMYNDMLNEWHHYDFTATASAVHHDSGADKKRVETIWWNDALHFNRVGEQQFLDLEVLM